MCHLYHCDYRPHSKVCFYLTDFQLSTVKYRFLFPLLRFLAYNHLALLKINFQENVLFVCLFVCSWDREVWIQGKSTLLHMNKMYPGVTHWICWINISMFLKFNKQPIDYLTYKPFHSSLMHLQNLHRKGPISQHEGDVLIFLTWSCC